MSLDSLTRKMSKYYETHEKDIEYNPNKVKIPTFNQGSQSNNPSPVSHPGGNNAVSMASADLGAGKTVVKKPTQTQFGIGYNKTINKPQQIPYNVSSFMPQTATTSANIKTDNKYLNNGLPLRVADPVSAQTYKDKASAIQQQITQHQTKLDPYKMVSGSMMNTITPQTTQTVPKGVSTLSLPVATTSKPQSAYDQKLSNLKGELAQAQNAGYAADYSQQWIALHQRSDADIIKQQLARMATLKASMGSDQGQNIAAMNEYLRIKGSLDKLGINAEGLADWLQRNADYVEAAQEVKAAQEYATEKPVRASLASIGQNLISGQGGLAGIAQSGMNRNSGEYRPINIYGDAFDASREKQTIRGTVGENISKNYGSAAKFLYDIGMSMADSGATAVAGMTPLGGAASIILGSAVASDTMMNVVERGGSTDQAVASGLLAGAAETVFESISLGKFLDTYKAGNAHGLKAHIKNILLQGTTEMSEEMATEIANIITDDAVMGSLSELNQMRANGASEADITKEIAKRVALAGLGGFLSGGVFGGVGSISNRTSMSLREQRALDALSKQTGVNIQVDDDIKGSNGYFDRNTNTLHISRNSNNAVYQVAAHEIAHFFEGNPAEWQQLYEIANANLSAEARANLEDLLKATGYTDAQMQSEVVSHYVQQCVTDIKSFEQLVGVNRTLAQRIVDAFETFVRKLTGQQNIGSWQETAQIRDFIGDITPEQAQQTLAQMKKALAAGGQATWEGTSQSKMMLGNIQYVKADRQVIDPNSKLTPSQQVENYIRETIAKNGSITIPTADGDSITINENTAWKMSEAAVTEHGVKYQLSDSEYQAKGTAAGHIDELIEVSFPRKSRTNTADRSKKRVKAKDGWVYRRAYFEDFDGKYYQVDFSVAKDEPTHLAYSMAKLKETPHPANKSRTGSKANSGVSTTNNTQNQAIVNTPVFKNPMTAALYKADMVDENGNPKSLKLTDTNPTEDGEVEISSETGTASASYSLKTWNETDKQRVVDDLVAKNKVSEEEAWKWVNDVNGVARMIASNRMLYDYEASPDYTAVKPNSEYKRTVDMSTNCKKRILLAGTIDEIQRRLPNVALTGEDYIKIREMMKDAGHEVSCGFCYVESRRKDLGKVAEQFVKQLGDPTVTISDITTEKGINYLMQYRPEVYQAFVAFNNKRGSGKVNLVQSRTEYRNEIMKFTAGLVKTLNDMGGLRVQSYSDFETPHLIDMMQVVTDMSRKGLKSQAYTKVPNFADAMGMTGMKINLSLVTSGLDANGNLMFDGVEGMPIEDALRLRELYSENVGTILVGKDDATILAAMADPNIDFIIPYHRSGWAQSEYEALGLVGYKDYTAWQSERLVNPTTKNGKTVTRPDSNYYPEEYWDYSKSGKENAEIYLAKCAAEGRIPKFDNFLVNNGDGSWSLQPDGSTDGYWKTLIDFKMYDNDGVGVPQRAVKPEFNPEVLERIMSEYKGDHRQAQVANDIVEKFLASRLSRKLNFEGGRKLVEQRTGQPLPYNPNAKRPKQIPYAPGYKAVNSPSETVSNAQASNLPKDTKSSYGSNTVGSAQVNPDSYAHLQNQYGTIEPGENPARVVDVPKKDAEGNVVSLFSRTGMESKHMPDELVEPFEQAIASGEFSHAVFSDKKAKEYAEHHVAQGFEHAWPLWRAVADGTKVATKDDIALGELLLANAMKDKQVDLAIQLTAELCAEATRAGQNVQAFRLLKKMTPEGQLFYLQKVVDKLNTEYEGRKDFDGIKLNEEQVNELIQASTKEEMDKAVDKIKQDIADQTPVTFEDKWNAWRYLAMLGNTRTQVRNILGNAVFLPVVKTKNLIATGIERAAGKRLQERTKAVLNPQKDKALISYGKNDFENVKADVAGGNKYTDQQDILSKRRIFKLENIERARILTNDVMEWGDQIFSKSHYATSLAAYMKANKLNPDTITPAQLNKARNYAIKEAQKATFRDANAFASFLNATKKNMAAKSRNADTKLGKVGWKAAEAVAEGIIPFTKTPANIMARGIEYSPVGLIYNLLADGKKIKNGKMTAAEAIDGIAAGLTGSGLFALGCLLASLGAVNGAAGDDKEDKYNTMLGEQEYALKVGDKSYTIDWLAPAALPFFTGVAVYEEVSQNGFELSQILDIMSAIGEPLFELSMVQGIDSALGATKYSDQAPIISVLSNAALGYVGQAVPTSFGQIARAVDKTRRQTYYDPNYKGIVKEGLAVGQKQVAKIPFASKALEPKVDMWGREQENAGGNFVGRLAYNMLSPGYASTNKATAVDKELQSLYKKTGESSVLPSYAPKTFELPASDGGDKVKLNAKEYTQYAKDKGSKAYDIFDSLIGSKGYKSLSDDEKVEVASKVYEYANAVAKSNVSDYTLRDTVAKIQKCEKAGIPAGVAIVAYVAQKDVKGDKDSKGNTIQYSASKNKKEAIDRMTPFITKKQRELLYDLFEVSEKVW